MFAVDCEINPRLGTYDQSSTSPLGFPGLWMLLFQKGYDPKIARFVGKRSEASGYTPGDAAIFNAMPFDSRSPSELKDNASRADVLGKYGGRDKVGSGGIATYPITWGSSFWRMDAPWTLGMMEDSIEECAALPQFWNYMGAAKKKMLEVEDRLRKKEGDEGVRKAREAFTQLYGFNSTNYRDMPAAAVREIGRKNDPRETEFGITGLDWDLERKASQAPAERLARIATIADLVNHGYGESAGTMYIGADPMNFIHNAGTIRQHKPAKPPGDDMLPYRRNCTIIGGRQFDSEMMAHLLDGTMVATRYATTPVVEKAGETVIEHPILQRQWVIEGLDKVAKEIWERVGRQTIPFDGIQMTVISEVDSREQPWIARRARELFALDFLRFDPDTVKPVVVAGSASHSKYF